MKSLREINRDNDLAATISAKKLVRVHGQSLIGKKVVTVAMGAYPGGVATVVEIAPDFAAPEIVFDVEHPTFGRIGVFGNEPVRLA